MRQAYYKWPDAYRGSSVCELLERSRSGAVALLVVQGIVDFLALAPIVDEACHSEYGQVPADGWLGKFKASAQAGDVGFTFLENVKNSQSGLVAKDVTQLC